MLNNYKSIFKNLSRNARYGLFIASVSIFILGMYFIITDENYDLLSKSFFITLNIIDLVVFPFVALNIKKVLIRKKHLFMINKLFTDFLYILLTLFIYYWSFIFLPIIIIRMYKIKQK